MFFCDNYCYPDPTVSSGKISTVEFLKASKGIVKFVELLGTVFSPVKFDINGNIEKLYKIYHSDEEKFKYLNDIVETEVNSSDDKIGIDALLWLKRALEYVKVFLACLVEDYKKGDCTENLTPFFNKAYEEKLKPYHGWIVQKLFAIIICAAPARKDLIKLLTSGKEGATEDDVINDVDNFLQGMNSNLTVIIELYQLYNLDSDAKV